MDYLQRGSSHGIVVGGAPRSGTTLTQVLLDSHPDIACAPESYLLAPDLAFNEYLLARRFGLSPREIRRMELRSHSYVEFVDGCMRAYARRRGALLWAEKTPRNVLNLGWILDRFPEVVFVNVVRDPRAVVASLVRHRNILAVGGIPPAEGGAALTAAIERWRLSVSSALQFADHARVRTVRYEDLVVDPAAAMAPVLDAVGMEWADSMLEERRSARAAEGVADYRISRNAVGPLDRSRLRAWDDELCPEELAQIERACGELLGSHGYT